MGEFKDWSPNGKGVETDQEGNQWVGVFEYGQPIGKGEYTGIDGTTYTGGFDYGAYDGQGVLTNKDGDRYSGEFSYGRKHGNGELEYKTALDGIKKFSGKWNRGNLVEGDDQLTIYSSENISEWALYNQQRLLDEALAQVSPGRSDKPDLFVLGIAGWGRQEVFRREIDFLSTQFSELYETQRHSIFLVNSQRNIHQRPIATVTSIEQSIAHLATIMDIEDDILFIYATSHGSEEDGFSLGHRGLSLKDLSPQNLADMLEASGIKHKVVVISACHSGVFIDALKNDTTLILTAASARKKSFGCGDDRLFTYFGKAFFEQSLTQSASFIDAFDQAKILIAEWETEEEITHSEPSMHSAKTIETKLAQWRQSLTQ